MPKKLTTEQFVEKAKNIHGYKYDYSKTIYIGNGEKVCITCPIHGEFWMTPNAHLNGQGCPMCGRENRIKLISHTTEQFIEKAKKVHGDKYDYSKVKYKNYGTKVCIICPEHGVFYQTPLNHLNGQKCPKCANAENAAARKKTFKDYVNDARKIHGDKYIYKEENYHGLNTSMTIICPEHGEFTLNPQAHLRGSGCPSCRKEDVETVNRKTEEFVEKARKVHGDKYDYSKVTYKTNRTKITIICPIHGEFKQTPNGHLNGCGCKKCGIEFRAKKKTYSTEQFIEKAQNVHGDKYDYSKVDMDNKDNNGKVCIICPKHGEFWQNPSAHLQGMGCKKCGNEKNGERNKLTTQRLITKAKEIHGNKYDYSKVNFVDYEAKVCVICPEHGEFWITPHRLLSGYGCRKCRLKKRTKTTEQFIQDARKIHGDKYDYSKADYKSVSKKICITCHKVELSTGKEHGDFWMTPNAHLHGQNCPRCSGRYHISNEEYIARAQMVHGNKYDCSLCDYKGSNSRLKIICPKHGVFEVNADNHLAGNNCPKCAIHLSSGEDELYNFIKEIVGEDNIVKRERNILNGKELDIYIPSKKIAIEYDGLIWHSEKFGKDAHYHLSKTEECLKKGIRLIHIFEDEFEEKRHIVFAYLRHILNADKHAVSIGARKCETKEITKDIARDFLTKYHIQGFVPSTLYLGSYYGDILVGVMSFKNENNGTWNLTRFATDFNYRLPGLASKMLIYFKRNNNFKTIKTFLDRRWNLEGNTMYEKIGFKLSKIEAPDYFYVKQTTRYHKFGFRKQIMHKKYGFPLTMTEHEMALKAGFYRIWNCGLVKYEMAT